jgi:hypothetical protein
VKLGLFVIWWPHGNGSEKEEGKYTQKGSMLVEVTQVSASYDIFIVFQISIHCALRSSVMVQGWFQFSLVYFCFALGNATF